MRRRGAELRTQVLSRGRLDAGDELAERACEAVGIADPHDVGCLLRLRFVDGVPLLLESLTFPAVLCPVLLEEPAPEASDPAARSFYDVLSESTGMRVTRAHEILRPAVVAGYEARLLRVPVGTAVFEVERTTFAGETAVEWRRTLARGDRYTYTVELVNPLDGDAYVLE
jgi:GntR family transcriptional regulator